ncbi:hypothetical protein TNCV_4400201 [Trichonephila clavipes]|nr:hypothetical protein TNCV_4400201 [Trichonephila clavipes]
MAAMVIGCDTLADDSTDVVGSKTNVLNTAVSGNPRLASNMKWWKVPRGFDPPDNQFASLLTNSTFQVKWLRKGVSLLMPFRRVYLEVLSKTLAVCGRALSCWKIAPGRPFRKGPTWDRRISSTKRWPVKVPRITIKVDRAS